MTQFIRLVSMLLLLSVVSSACGQSSTATKLDELFSSLHEQGKFNGNVLIAEQGKTIFQKSFGLANEQSGEKLTDESVFELASVSKQFTAMAIMILQEKGKLALDDPIIKYLPELTTYHRVTIRQLLHHTGGLPDYMEMMARAYDQSKIATNKEMIEVFAENKPPARFEPDSKYEYSDTGYALLASIVERISGQAYAEFLKRHIFKPLKMRHSLVTTRRYKPEKIKHYTQGYVYSSRYKRFIQPDSLPENRNVIYLDGIVGDGGVNATAGDLLKWDRALYTTKLVSQASLREIFTSGVLTNKKPTNYGYGWELESSEGLPKIAHHTGVWAGYVSYIERNVALDKTIILLTNHEGSTLPVKAIRKILYP